ncbi:CPBP family intramembrane glutamic endopeptidase [Butyrivibrio sp. VCB2006]|uniref:CPBP family intramembrane glutamic endopeptidase n=1 Tax=Butyrivibrio sp. VCB2006 TaxID=1280679 RepID=UPI00040EEC66|nr:CPBP family intramembrane glutamic endopeptidase [Butyrivibrio sp. VCB2006]
MKTIRWYNYIEVAAICIIATVTLTFLFGLLGLTDNEAYSEIAQHQFFGHNSLAETIGLYCFVSPVVEELIFRFGIFNLLLIILKRAVGRSIRSDVEMDTFVNPFVSTDNNPSNISFLCRNVTLLPKLVHVAVWFTALLFGIYHMNLIQGLYAFLMGLVITYSYAVYRKFSIPVVAHICANATALFITYLL